MNELSSYLRRTLCEAWRNGYGEEARRAAIVAPLLTLIGFAAAWFFPQLTDHVMGVLEQAIDSAGLSSVTETRDMAAAIFANNLTAAFSAILWGLVPFAYLAAFPLGFNFFLIGALGVYYVRSGVGLGSYLVGILPHGVFELPALVLFCAAGLYLCSRVVASNMAVSVPGGHMAGSLAYEAKTAEEAAAYVERIAAEKPDLIKLMITGGVLDAEVVGEPGVLRMQPALVKAACDKAHALGMKVAAHVESPEGVRVALENGVDSIEHGAQPDAAITALYKEKGAFQVATLSPALPYALFDRSVSHATYEQQENGKVVFDGIIAMARENLANGIPVGLGTDTGCPYITHYDMWRELCYFVKYCGVTPAFALHTATRLNARLAGIDGETGSIEAGKAADLIVCAKDPLADLSALRTLSMVIKDGYRVEHPAPKKLPEVERELDKFL